MNIGEEGARKIREGYSYSFVNGDLVWGAKDGFDIEAFKKKCERKTATLADVQDYLLTRL